MTWLERRCRGVSNLSLMLPIKRHCAMRASCKGTEMNFHARTQGPNVLPGGSVLYGHACQSQPCSRISMWTRIEVWRTYLFVDFSAPPLETAHPTRIHNAKENDNHAKCETRV